MQCSQFEGDFIFGSGNLDKDIDVMVTLLVIYTTGSLCVEICCNSQSCWQLFLPLMLQLQTAIACCREKR